MEYSLKDAFLPARRGARNPFRPQKGMTLSGAGQCMESFFAMQQMQGDARKPALIALYESIGENGYRPNADIAEAGTLFPGVVLQIGLQLPVHNENALNVLARADEAPRAVARRYKAIGAPILLRLGYEFDGVDWNGYEPRAYIAAYRRIADALAEEGAENVALCWDSHTIDVPNVMDWFPGEEYVDWIGYNTLAPRFSSENNMAALARDMDKPLMNGEASYAINVMNMPFSTWADRYFSSMRALNVQAYQYINWRWRVYPPQMGWSDWADGRITEDAEKARAYMAAMTRGDMVYRGMDYPQPVRLIADFARALTPGHPRAAWRVSADHAVCLPGYGYSAHGATAAYGDGMGTGLQGSVCLRFTVADGFAGDCLLKTTHGAKALTVNGKEYPCAENGGCVHVPYTGDPLCVTLTDDLLSLAALVERRNA